MRRSIPVYREIFVYRLSKRGISSNLDIANRPRYYCLLACPTNSSRTHRALIGYDYLLRHCERSCFLIDMRRTNHFKKYIICYGIYRRTFHKHPAVSLHSSKPIQYYYITGANIHIFTIFTRIKNKD